MGYYTADPERDAERWAEDGEAWLASRPICDECGDPIVDPEAYHIRKKWYCRACMLGFLEEIEED